MNQLITEPNFVDDQQTVLIRMENETIQSMAKAQPRDPAKILAALKHQVNTYPALAAQAVYRKPCGQDERGQMKFARGLSIRAAEALASVYGYCRVRSDVEIIDDDRVRVTATFTDLQNGRVWQEAGIISKFYRNRFKQLARHDDDRFFNVVVKAETSKRLREVILRSIDPGLKLELQTLCERKMAELLDGNASGRLVDAFANLGVTLEQLEDYLGKPITGGLTNTDRVKMQEIWTAIDSEETTVAEVFSKQQPVMAQKPVAVVSTEPAPATEPAVKFVRRRAKAEKPTEPATEPAPATELEPKSMTLADAVKEAVGGTEN